MIFKHPALYIDKSSVDGYGVFVSKRLEVGDLIEECPIPQTRFPISYKNIYEHLMPYPSLENTQSLWIPSGFATLLNHADVPNIRWHIDEDKQIAYFFSCDFVRPNEELFINYLKNS